MYNVRTHAAYKLVEGAETLINFLENMIFVSTDMDQKVELYQELYAIVSQLAELVNFAKRVWINYQVRRLYIVKKFQTFSFEYFRFL